MRRPPCTNAADVDDQSFYLLSSASLHHYHGRHRRCPGNIDKGWRWIEFTCVVYHQLVFVNRGSPDQWTGLSNCRWKPQQNVAHYTQRNMISGTTIVHPGLLYGTEA